MITIRRAVGRNKSYTVIFLKGEPPKWIPTTDYEHQRILQIYKQDKPYEGIENDFTELKELYPNLSSITTEKFKESVIKEKITFLNSTLDKEKNRSTIEKQHEYKK